MSTGRVEGKVQTVEMGAKCGHPRATAVIRDGRIQTVNASSYGPQSHLRDQHITHLNPTLTTEILEQRLRKNCERTEGLGTEPSQLLPTLPELAWHPPFQF